MIYDTAINAIRFQISLKSKREIKIIHISKVLLLFFKQDQYYNNFIKEHKEKCEELDIHTDRSDKKTNSAQNLIF